MIKLTLLFLLIFSIMNISCELEHIGLNKHLTFSTDYIVHLYDHHTKHEINAIVDHLNGLKEIKNEERLNELSINKNDLNFHIKHIYTNLIKGFSIHNIQNENFINYIQNNFNEIKFIKQDLLRSIPEQNQFENKELYEINDNNFHRFLQGPPPMNDDDTFTTDVDLNKLWNLDILDGSIDDQFSSSLNGSNVDIYIVDTGLDTNHENFDTTGSNREVKNVWDGYISDSENPSDDNDGHAHGTHCILGISINGSCTNDCSSNGWCDSDTNTCVCDYDYLDSNDCSIYNNIESCNDEADPTNSSLLQLWLYDGYGDGWENTLYDITPYSGGSSIGEGYLECSYAKTDNYCLDQNSCYSITLEAGGDDDQTYDDSFYFLLCNSLYFEPFDNIYSCFDPEGDCTLSCLGNEKGRFEIEMTAEEEYWYDYWMVVELNTINFEEYGSYSGINTNDVRCLPEGQYSLFVSDLGDSINYDYEWSMCGVSGSGPVKLDVELDNAGNCELISCDNTTVPITLIDADGDYDGWDTTFLIYDENDNLIVESTLFYGFKQSNDVCLPDGSYTFEINQAYSASDYSYKLCGNSQSSKISTSFTVSNGNCSVKNSSSSSTTTTVIIVGFLGVVVVAGALFFFNSKKKSPASEGYEMN